MWKIHTYIHSDGDGSGREGHIGKEPLTEDIRIKIFGFLHHTVLPYNQGTPVYFHENLFEILGIPVKTCFLRGLTWKFVPNLAVVINCKFDLLRVWSVMNTYIQIHLHMKGEGESECERESVCVRVERGGRGCVCVLMCVRACVCDRDFFEVILR